MTRKLCTAIEPLEAFTEDAQSEDWDLSLEGVLLAHRSTNNASNGVSPVKMLLGRGMIEPSTEATKNVFRYVLLLKDDIKSFTSNVNVLSVFYQAEETLRKQSQTDAYKVGLVYIRRPIFRSGGACNFHHLYIKGLFRMIKFISPTNQALCNANAIVAVHHNKKRPSKCDNEVGVLTEEGKSPNSIIKDKPLG